ncbi:MAG: site-specific DNA-methyltransferase [Acetanaerobacterium sp.]
MERNVIYNRECIVGMSQLPDKSIDMILCDLPYGITGCSWDGLIPFDQLWQQYERIIKDNGAIVLTACQPFTTQLIASNRRLFRYCWYWLKNQSTGFPFAKYQPLRCVEDIAVFYKRAPTYYPQGLVELETPLLKGRKRVKDDGVYHKGGLESEYLTRYMNYPRQTLQIKCERGLHPTQKPVALFEYLIKTYTNKGDLVLDNCIGSGTTAVACINSERDYVGFEITKEFFRIATERVIKEQKAKSEGY